jgi:hypothetical protein
VVVRTACVQITESLKRFGVGDDARALLVARFDGAPEEVRAPAEGPQLRLCADAGSAANALAV